MTKLNPQIDVFERLAKAAQLRAEGAGPWDKKPNPRPPMPNAPDALTGKLPSPIVPERKNTLEGKPKPKELTEKERMEGLLGKPNKKKDVAEKPKAKEHIPSIQRTPGGHIKDPSDKDLEVLERQRQDYFSRQKQKPEMDAAQQAESERIKNEYAEYIKKNDPQGFIAYMKSQDPNYNPERYLKMLREKKKQVREEQETAREQGKFKPNYESETLPEAPEPGAPRPTEPGLGRFKDDVEMLGWFHDDIKGFYTMEEFMHLAGLMDLGTPEELSNLRSVLKKKNKKPMSAAPEGEKVINETEPVRKFVDTGVEEEAKEWAADPKAAEMVDEFVQELTDNELDIYDPTQFANLLQKTKMTATELKNMLAEQGKYLMTGAEAGVGKKQVIVPQEIIDRAAQMLDMEDSSKLMRFLADLPQENQPRSVNELVEMFLDQTGFYNEEV